MTESAYLKDDLGPVLAKGLAAVSTAKPQDPVEYLALWMLHHLQQRERKAQQAEAARELEASREEWAKGRSQREKAATSVIQREWKAHVRSQEDRKRQEVALRELFASIDEVAEERYPDEYAKDEEGKGENEKNAEQERLSAYTAFQRAGLYVGELDKSALGELKRLNGNSKSVDLTMRSVFYAMGMRPKQVDSWDKIRVLIKPFPLSQWFGTYDPVNPKGEGVPLERIRPVNRIRRLLSLVNEDELKGESAAVHVIFQWLNAAVQARVARDEHIKAKRSVGRDAEEELDEEEENEDEEKDADEEVVREAELQALREAEAERLAEEAEEAPVDE